MRYHLQLMEQAQHLARREATRPRQASLRRAVSTAYYALFHFLTEEACCQVFGRGAERRRSRLSLGRAFEHGQMKNASRSFGSGAMPAGLSWAAPIPAPVRFIADTFVTLQEERHQADYDLARSFTRAEALHLIARVELALQQWPTIQQHDCARLYLVSLLTWGTLSRR